MKLFVTDQTGVRRELDDSSPHSVMDVIRLAGLPIAAQCGGSASCATCHVYVDEAWLSRLPPMAEMEREMLELAVEPTDASRLSCQLPWRPELDGLTVRLAPGTEF